MFTFLLFLVFSFGTQELLKGNISEPVAKQEDKSKPSKISLSLKKAVLMAMENNLDIEIARFQPLIDGASVTIYESPFNYRLWGQVGTNIGKTKSVTFPGQPLQYVDSISDSLSFGASKMIPYGAVFDLNYSLTESNSTYSDSGFEIDRWSQSLALSVTVPILKGAGVDYNYTSLLISRNTRDSSIFTYEKNLTDTIYGIHQAYWNLVLAIEQRQVKEQSLAVAMKLRDETARKLEHGVVIKLELTQAEAGVASRQEGILTARANVLNAMDELKRQVDPALLRGEERLQPSDKPKGVEKSIEEKKAVEQALLLALKHRPDYLQINLQIDSQDLTMNKADGDFLPKLNVIGTAGISGVGLDYSDSNDDFFDTDTNSLGVIVDFEYFLGQSAAQGSFDAAHFAKRQLQISRKDLENKILVEVRQAVRSILTNEKRIEATKKARILGEEQFQAELNRKKRQVSTTFQVLNMQEDLAEAQANEIKAMIDYQLSLINLKRVTGTLLKEMGVKLEEMLTPRTK